MKNIYVFLVCLLFFQTIEGQVVLTSPRIANLDQPLSITFRSDQGNKGLDNTCYSGNIYAHTGVVTSKSKNSFDWKYIKTDWGDNIPSTKLKKISQNTYQLDIVPTIRSYYKIPKDEEVLQLAFVFRSESPNKKGQYYEGKTADYNDILINIGKDNNNFYPSSNQIKSIPPTNPPTKTQLGINYLENNTVRLMLYAPNKEYVHIIGDFNDWNVNSTYQMTPTTDGKSYWIDLKNLKKDQIYRFQYLVDGELRVADPFSELILDPWNDHEIDSLTFPNLKPYPKGKTMGLVSVFETNPKTYEWEIKDFKTPEKTDLVIYELLLRDFLDDHNYQTLKDTLNYLENLGVNAIELMPIQEFFGNNSWGFNPTFHTALDKYYGTKKALKEFIDECHKRGIAVILDVVYNHIDGYWSPLGRLYWDACKNQPNVDNPWLNPQTPHPFVVFHDFNHEKVETKDYVKQCLEYWKKEYNIDGFRFDLSKGFTQRKTRHDGFRTNDIEVWSQYDPHRINTLKEIANNLWKKDSTFLVILEHLGQEKEEKELADYGFLLWNNMNCNFSSCGLGRFEKTTCQGGSDISKTYFKEKGWKYPHNITYYESHDEERLMYKNLNWGNDKNESYNVKDTTIALQRQELINVFFFMIPGPKMLWQFSELGADQSIYTNPETNEIPQPYGKDDYRLSPKKPLWELSKNPRRKKLYTTIKDLIHLKKHPAFHSDSVHLKVGEDDKVKQITIVDPTLSIVVIGNFDVQQQQQNVIFPKGGIWYEYFSNQTIEILKEKRNQTIQLNPGAYQIYLSKKYIRSSIQNQLY